MARGRKKKSHNIGHANFSSNRERRIKTEINKAEKKMAKLLRLFEEGRPRNCCDKVRKIQGMKPNSQRHRRLQAHISRLVDKL
ncbi:MAG: hypothetical protein ACWGQW_01750 [bacterium]